MPHSPGKFCIDRNLVRWTLLNGMITRKNVDAGPTAWKELPASQVTAIEKVSVKKVDHRPFGWPLVILGAILLAVCSLAGSHLLQIVLGGAGLICLYKGAKRIPPITTEVEAHQIVAPGVKPEDWLVVGSTAELSGFLDAVRAEQAQQKEAIEAPR